MPMRELPMTGMRAMSLIEGMTQGDEDEVLEAWQWIVDHGYDLTLPGRYGRTARNLIEQGLIQPRAQN